VTVPIGKWWNRAQEVPGAPRVRGLAVTADEWKQSALDAAASGGRLLALWTSDHAHSATTFGVFAAYWLDQGILLAELRVQPEGDAPAYPGLEETFPAASRMQRAAFDLSGVRSSDPDRRPWLKGGSEYDFVRVEGEGVHEIAVGPVHAGTIEPGHFRFSVVGEKVLRLEEHLGYVHKGIERRFTELPILNGHRLAARVSGDSAVAFSWSYCQALEGIAGCAIPPRALWLRALFLELERIANHLGDLGALGNDAGFAFGLAQFSRLKEQLLRAMDAALGQRYLLDAVVPGGTRVDVTAQSVQALTETLSSIARESEVLHGIYEDHSGIRDRFTGTGRLDPELASRLGVLGLAARASGQRLDARVDLPCKPYDELPPVKIVRPEGDVAARVAVRFDEVQESCRLARHALLALPDGPHAVPVEYPPAGAFGVGLIEGWRGPVFVALEAGPSGAVHRCHPHDPSWQCWPAIEHAIIGNIVPDFPLINKSFNLSYSGVDL
jgi:Ni,Fe-hydrogenase III large subunit